MKLEWNPVDGLRGAECASVMADDGRVLTRVYRSLGSVYVRPCYYVWGEYTDLRELVVAMKAQTEAHLGCLDPKRNSASKKEAVAAIARFDAWLDAHKAAEATR